MNVEIDDKLYENLIKLGLIPNEIRSHNVGKSDYSKHTIQPWSIWIDYNMDPWDADITKRVCRTKEEPGMSWEEARIMDYEKIIHNCQEKIRQLKQKTISVVNSQEANSIDIEDCENPTQEMILSWLFTTKGLEIYNRFLYEHELCRKDIVVVKKGDTFLLECPICKTKLIMPPNSVVEEVNINDKMFEKYGIHVKEIK